MVRNPCIVKGASTERSVATIAQVFELADTIAPELSAAVLLATFCGLRLGEIRALRVRHLDLLHRTVRIEEQYQERSDGTLVLGPPNTKPGMRTIGIAGLRFHDLRHTGYTLAAAIDPSAPNGRRSSARSRTQDVVRSCG